MPYKNSPSFTTNEGIKNFDGPDNDNASARRVAPNPAGGAEVEIGGLPPDGVVQNGETLRLRGQAYGANYYLTGLRIEEGGRVVIDTASGDVTIWVDSAGADYVKGNVEAPNGSTRIRIYYRNASGAGLTIGNRNRANVSLLTSVYAYDYDPNLNREFGSVSIEGGVALTGSVIAKDVRVENNASFTLTFPNNRGATQGEGLLYYGFLPTSWSEYNPIRPVDAL